MRYRRDCSKDHEERRLQSQYRHRYHRNCPETSSTTAIRQAHINYGFIRDEEEALRQLAEFIETNPKNQDTLGELMRQQVTDSLNNDINQDKNNQRPASVRDEDCALPPTPSLHQILDFAAAQLNPPPIQQVYSYT